LRIIITKAKINKACAIFISSQTRGFKQTGIMVLSFLAQHSTAKRKLVNKSNLQHVVLRLREIREYFLSACDNNTERSALRQMIFVIYL